MILEKFKLTSKQQNQFKLYSEFLVEENKKYNLTSIVEEREIYIKHFYDSLEVSYVVDFDKISTFCDIGSGAGFPGIPLKILYPHLKLTIIEPTMKRCKFLAELVSLLKLEDVIILNKRSEDIEIEERDYFDVVAARAVATLPILLELTTPYLKVGGSFLALKGSNYQEELTNSKKAIEKLDLEFKSNYNFILPEDMGTRTILEFIKNKKTNLKYPRKFSIIKKQHL